MWIKPQFCCNVGFMTDNFLIKKRKIASTQHFIGDETNGEFRDL